MKRFNKIFLTSATLIGLAIGCKDDSLSPYIEPNGGASGLGQFVSLVGWNDLVANSNGIL
jgi:hypothetical protein